MSGRYSWKPEALGRFMIYFGPISSIFDITTFCMMWFVFAANSPEHQSLFQSGWFIEGLLSQTLIVHMIRTQKIAFIQSRASFALLVMTTLVMAAGIYLPMSDFGQYFKFQTLPLAFFAGLVAMLLSYMLLTQAMKGFFIRRYGWQ